MLKLLGKKELAKKIIFSVLILISVLAFVVWGLGASRMSAKTRGYAGEIFARKIPLQEFLTARAACINNARLRFGEDYSKILQYININSQAWIQLIMLEEAKKSKIQASDQEVIQAIMDNPIFSKGGRFSKENYIRITRYFFKAQPREFEEQTRNNLTISKLNERLTKDIRISDEELLEAYKEEFQTLSVGYATTQTKDFLQQVTASEDELKDYYLNNSDKFKRPPTAKIEYIGIEYLADAKEPDQAKVFKQVEAAYQDILRADKLKDAARPPFIYQESEFFAANEPIKDIGYQAQFHKYAFALQERETSPIIQTSRGVYALRVIQRKESYIPELQEVKERVKDALLNKKADQEAKKKIQDYKAALEDYLTKNPQADFKKAGLALGIELKTSSIFKRESGIPEIGPDKQFSRMAFSLKPKQISETIQTSSGYLLMAQDKFTDIDRERFKQEKEGYRETLLEEKKAKYLNSFIEGLLTKANLKEYIGKF